MSEGYKITRDGWHLEVYTNTDGATLQGDFDGHDGVDLWFGVHEHNERYVQAFGVEGLRELAAALIEIANKMED